MSTYISYCLKDKKGKAVYENYWAACFSAVTYYEVSPEAVTLEIWQSIHQIAYARKYIIWWIHDLNEWGFPCRYLGKEKRTVGDSKVESHVFSLELKDYIGKSHLTSALTLIRYLIEDNIKELPRHYFRLREEAPEADKFKVMLVAHWFYSTGNYPNYNHTIRRSSFNSPMSKETIFKRLKACGKKNPVYGSTYGNIQGLWEGKNYIWDSSVEYATISQLVQNLDYKQISNYIK